jgi:hypothetical protein
MWRRLGNIGLLVVLLLIAGCGTPKTPNIQYPRAYLYGYRDALTRAETSDDGHVLDRCVADGASLPDPQRNDYDYGCRDAFIGRKPAV